MTAVGRKHGHGADLIIADAKNYLGPTRAALRQAQVEALPNITWKGRELYTLRCRGTSGKGEHNVNVPLAMVWSLLSLGRFFCVYHAGDAWGETHGM